MDECMPPKSEDMLKACKQQPLSFIIVKSTVRGKSVKDKRARSAKQKLATMKGHIKTLRHGPNKASCLLPGRTRHIPSGADEAFHLVSPTESG